MKKIVIVGYGHVGKSVHELFPESYIYDPFLNLGKKEDLKEIDVAFICVPTPSLDDGSCDTSIVEEIISWLNAKIIIIRSTVEVGFTAAMVTKYHKSIVFQPEYYGETKNHPYSSEKNVSWVTIGGEKEYCDLAKEIYKDKNVKINISTSSEAEMAKYMCNAFLASKVVFCNEIYDLCEKMGINYNNVKELWLNDPRIGKSHFDVYPENRGFGGHCFPKDTAALLSLTKKYKSENNQLKATIKANKILRNKNKN